MTVLLALGTGNASGSTVVHRQSIFDLSIDVRIASQGTRLTDGRFRFKGELTVRNDAHQVVRFIAQRLVLLVDCDFGAMSDLEGSYDLAPGEHLTFDTVWLAPAAVGATLEGRKISFEIVIH